MGGSPIHGSSEVEPLWHLSRGNSSGSCDLWCWMDMRGLARQRQGEEMMARHHQSGLRIWPRVSAHSASPPTHHLLRTSADGEDDSWTAVAEVSHSGGVCSTPETARLVDTP